MRIERIETWSSAEDGLAALKTIRLGRLSASLHALPVIMPVPFAIDHDAIAISVPNDRAFVAALDRAVVAFEGGAFDDVESRGWTVHVQGIASIIEPLSPVDESALARISPQLMEGYTYRLLPSNPEP